MNQSLYTFREGKSANSESVPDAVLPSADRVFSMCNAMVRLLAATASMHLAPTTSAWAQEATKAATVISTDCLQVLSVGADEALIKLTKGQLQGDLDGAPLVKFPATCLSKTEPAVPPPPAEENHDANSMRDTLDELIKLLQARGVPPENLAKPKSDVDNIIGRNEGKPDVREPVLQASEEASKGDDATTAALLGLMTAGCVALTGGAACAILPAIFGDLFKGQVTQAQIEGASRIATKIAEGQPLEDADYNLLSDLGAEKWATDGLRALQNGKYEEIIVAIGKANGVSEENISLLQKLAKIAETGEITCAVLDGVVGSSITIDSQTRRAVDEIAFRSRNNLSESDRDNLKNCLDRALAGGG